MSEDKVRGVLKEALRVWSDVTPLSFREVHEGRADIIIDFTRSEGTGSCGRPGQSANYTPLNLCITHNRKHLSGIYG